MAGKIFINYRRDDAIGMAGRLHDRLAQAFGQRNVFMDVDHIPAGVDFVHYLNSQVAACEVFLALIGPNWLNGKDESGARRIDNPDDFVTIEIAAALARDVRVIPVLIEGTRIPKLSELPEPIKPLVRRQAVEVRHAHFGRDADALVARVRNALSDDAYQPGRRRALIAAAAVVTLVLAGWIGVHLLGIPMWMIQWSDHIGVDQANVDAKTAEAKRKAEEAEQQRLAAIKAEEEKVENAADAEARRRDKEAQQQQFSAAAGTSTTVSQKNWLMPTGDYANRRYSELKQITAENVGKLQVASSFSTGVLRGHEGGPLVVDNVMFVHTPYPNIVYALDLSQDGKILWKYAPIQDAQHVIPRMCCDTVNRGPSYADGKIFLHRADTMLVALDARTGKVVWSVKNGDPEKGETGTSSPMVFKDKVIVGVSGGEFGVRGFVTAYNVKDGKRVWRAYSMGPDSDTLLDPARTTSLGTPVGLNSGMNTWQGEQWKIGGGTTWGWYSYDPELNLFYYGSGNPSAWNAKQRPGDNRWSTTILARDVDTGQARWVYQMTPHDEWAFDGVNEMILVDQNIGGRARRTLVHFDRNGFAYVLDRTNGELLLAEKYDSAVNWATKIDTDRNSSSYGRPVKALAYSPKSNGEDVNTKGICPSSMGTKNQQPTAFSPKTGLFYVPTTHLCMDYEPFRVSYSEGQPYVGASLKMYTPSGETNLGNFIAWDARSGKIVWSIKEQFAVWSGALATAGDVVFYGTLEGYLKAVDARNGKELYRYKTVSGIIGNVITYEHGGRQYVAVLSGIGGWPGIGLAAGLSDPSAGLGAVGAFAALNNYTSLGGQLTVFALPK